MFLATIQNIKMDGPYSLMEFGWGKHNHLKLVNCNGWKSFQQDSLRPQRAGNMRANAFKDFIQEQAGNSCQA